MMQKIAAFGYIAILVLLLFTSGVQAQTAIAPPSGDGSQSDPYLITSLENLYWISQNEDTWNKFFLQTANIDASPSHSWHPYDHDNDPATADVPMGFPSIGYFNFSSVAFMGHYDGGGFTISNLYMHNPDAYALGLFGNTSEASITRLGLNDLIIIGGNYVGGIIGTANKTDLSYCYASGELKGYDCGLLTGELNYSNITNCYARGNIAEGRSDGLLASGSQSQITNCSALCLPLATIRLNYRVVYIMISQIRFTIQIWPEITLLSLPHEAHTTCSKLVPIWKQDGILCTKLSTTVWAYGG